MNDMQMIERLTLCEYWLRMKAYQLKQVDEMYNIRSLAWSIRAANSVDEDGKYTYQGFNDFFNYEKAQELVLHPVTTESEMDPKLVKIARRLQNYRGKEVKHG